MGNSRLFRLGDEINLSGFSDDKEMPFPGEVRFVSPERLIVGVDSCDSDRLGGLTPLKLDEIKTLLPEDEMKDESSYLDIDSIIRGAEFPIPLKRNEAWGYVDADGKEVLPFEYDSAWPFEQGTARVMVGDVGFNINLKGEWIDVFEQSEEEGMIPVFLLLGVSTDNQTPDEIISVFKSAVEAEGALKELRDLDVQMCSIFESVPTVRFDQKDCYWNDDKILVVTRLAIHSYNGDYPEFVYTLQYARESNVGWFPDKDIFVADSPGRLFSEMDRLMAKNEPSHRASIHDSDSVTESFRYQIGHFCLNQNVSR